jgi:hypothetical protein
LPRDTGEGGGGDLVPLGSRHGGFGGRPPSWGPEVLREAGMAWTAWRGEVRRCWRLSCVRCAGDLRAGAQMGLCGPRWARAGLAPFSRLLGPGGGPGDAAWPCRRPPGGRIQLPPAVAAVVAATMQVPLGLVRHRRCSAWFGLLPRMAGGCSGGARTSACSVHCPAARAVSAPSIRIFLFRRCGAWSLSYHFALVCLLWEFPGLGES